MVSFAIVCIMVNNKKMNSGHKTLVVLSIPFQRLIRSHLSPSVLNTLLSKADVLIASPFADNPQFVEKYCGSGLSHVLTLNKMDLNIFLRAMFNISTVFRMRGYWFRNRRKIPYYWKSRYIRLAESGKDQKLCLPYF